MHSKQSATNLVTFISHNQTHQCIPYMCITVELTVAQDQSWIFLKGTRRSVIRSVFLLALFLKKFISRAGKMRMKMEKIIDILQNLQKLNESLNII